MNTGKPLKRSLSQPSGLKSIDNKKSPLSRSTGSEGARKTKTIALVGEQGLHNPREGKAPLNRTKTQVRVLTPEELNQPPEPGAKPKGISDHVFRDKKKARMLANCTGSPAIKLADMVKNAAVIQWQDKDWGVHRNWSASASNPVALLKSSEGNQFIVAKWITGPNATECAELHLAAQLDAKTGKHVVELLDILPGNVFLFEYIRRGDGEKIQEKLLQAEKDAIRKKDPDIGKIGAAKRVLVHDACLALRQLHGQGIVHCDVKLGNFLVSDAMRLLITDFDVARPDTDEIRKIGSVIQVHNRSPKIAEEDEVRVQKKTKDPFSIGPEADLWQLGLTIFQLIGGSPNPFQAEDVDDSSATLEILRGFARISGRDERLAWLSEKIDPALLKLDYNQALLELAVDLLSPDDAQRPKLKTLLKGPLFADLKAERKQAKEWLLD